MNRVLLALAIVAFAAGASAEPVLLAEWLNGMGGTSRHRPITQIQFFIKAPSSSGTLCSVGLSRTFGDGEVGIYDFIPSDPLETEFEYFQENVTDGIDGTIGHWVHLHPNIGRGGSTVAESALFGTESDLIGCEITFMRLVIDTLSIEPYQEGSKWFTRARWEFWGSSSAVAVEDNIVSASWGHVRSLYR
jgi:hypothetical protein